jgi:hypothetical protein
MRHTFWVSVTLLVGLACPSQPAHSAKLFFASFGSDSLGRVETATGNVTIFPGAGIAAPISALTFDASGRLWGNSFTGIGEFDTHTGSFSLLVDPTTIIDPNSGMPGFPAEVLAAGPVPEPSSIVLISSAAIGLFAFVRRAT